MIRDDPFIVPPHIAALAHGPIYACRPDARQYTIPTRGQIRWHQVRSLLGWRRWHVCYQQVQDAETRRQFNSRCRGMRAKRRTDTLLLFLPFLLKRRRFPQDI